MNPPSPNVGSTHSVIGSSLPRIPVATFATALQSIPSLFRVEDVVGRTIYIHSHCMLPIQALHLRIPQFQWPHNEDVVGRTMYTHSRCMLSIQALHLRIPQFQWPHNEDVVSRTIYIQSYCMLCIQALHLRISQLQWPHNEHMHSLTLHAFYPCPSSLHISAPVTSEWTRVWPTHWAMTRSRDLMCFGSAFKWKLCFVLSCNRPCWRSSSKIKPLFLFHMAGGHFVFLSGVRFFKLDSLL